MSKKSKAKKKFKVDATPMSNAAKVETAAYKFVKRKTKKMVRRAKKRGSDEMVFVTVSPLKPKAVKHRKAYNNKRSLELLDFLGQFMKRFDRRLYGRNCGKGSSKDPFYYFARVETKSKLGSDTEPHVHIIMCLSAKEKKVLFKSKKGTLKFKKKIDTALRKLCKQRSYRWDVDVREHDGKSLDYLAKHAYVDMNLIFWRPDDL